MIWLLLLSLSVSLTARGQDLGDALVSPPPPRGAGGVDVALRSRRFELDGVPWYGLRWATVTWTTTLGDGTEISTTTRFWGTKRCELRLPLGEAGPVTLHINQRGPLPAPLEPRLPEGWTAEGAGWKGGGPGEIVLRLPGC